MVAVMFKYKELNIDAGGFQIYFKGYGLIKVFEAVSKNGGLEYWVTK